MLGWVTALNGRGSCKELVHTPFDPIESRVEVVTASSPRVDDRTLPDPLWIEVSEPDRLRKRCRMRPAKPPDVEAVEHDDQIRSVHVLVSDLTGHVSHVIDPESLRRREGFVWRVSSRSNEAHRVRLEASIERKRRRERAAADVTQADEENRSGTPLTYDLKHSLAAPRMPGAVELVSDADQ